MIDINVKKTFAGDAEDLFSLDISFKVDGGFIVLTGPSGSGKTTTLKLIAGIIAPDEGNIFVGGETYFDSESSIDLSIQKRSVGFVFQDYALFPHMTSLENITYGVKNENSLARKATAREMLSLFKIEHIAKRLPADISGGEQQRVALARALASSPKIVLLDEPLSAVDVETRSLLLDEIELAQSRTGVPFIYVTHNEAEAERLAKHRIVLKNGSLV